MFMTKPSRRMTRARPAAGTAIAASLVVALAATPAFARMDPEVPPLLLQEAKRQLSLAAAANDPVEPGQAAAAPDANRAASPQNALGLAEAALAGQPAAPPQPAATQPAAAALPVAPPQAATATPPAPAVATATTVPPAAASAADMPAVDSASVSAALKALMQSGAGGLVHDRKTLAAVSTFYEANGFQPVWTDGKGLASAANRVVARIAAAGDDGLNAKAFAPLLQAANAGGTPSAESLARSEAAVSLAVAGFAAQAWSGTVVPLSVNKLITRKPDPFDALAALNAVASAPDRAAALDAFDPPSPQFAHLKALLAQTRKEAAGEPLPQALVPDGPALKPGMQDQRVASLRLRLGITATTGSDATVYDDALASAVRDVQKTAGLPEDGVVNRRTVAALNAAKSKVTVPEILAVMEMWRWMPRNFGQDFVLVNIPDFMVDVVRDGKLVHTTKVVVGKPATGTPLFSGVMSFLIVNPSWNVPESIRVKEFLPQIRKDPRGFFYNHGYEAVKDGEVVDPATVDWDNEITKVGIRQPPGDDNALGHIKFMFPNQHAVYLHDTSSRKLFARTVRAFSHGCVRVDKPLDFATAILQGDPVWTAEKVSALYGGPEQRIDLVHKLNVHIGYFTVWVDDGGHVQHRNDIYGYSARVAEALATQGNAE